MSGQAGTGADFLSPLRACFPTCVAELDLLVSRELLPSQIPQMDVSRELHLIY